MYGSLFTGIYTCNVTKQWSVEIYIQNSVLVSMHFHYFSTVYYCLQQILSFGQWVYVYKRFQFLSLFSINIYSQQYHNKYTIHYFSSLFNETQEQRMAAFAISQQDLQIKFFTYKL
jgi:hypothetical protein